MVKNDIIGCYTPMNSLHSDSSHGSNIKRRLRAHSSTQRLHSLITANSNTAVTCILSRDDDDDRLSSVGTSRHSRPGSVKQQLNSAKTPTMRRTKKARSRGIKRHRKGRGKLRRKHVKRIHRNLDDESFVPSSSHFVSSISVVAMETRKKRKTVTSTPPISGGKRARTAATSPRVVLPDTPQLRMRQLVRARCQTGTLEEARQMSDVKRYHWLTQNDIIARQVQERSQQPVWWDDKMIECHKSKSRMMCTSLEKTASSTVTVKQYAFTHLVFVMYV